jgi:hypothetical protein
MDSQMRKFKPSPQEKPTWMSDEDWQDHLEEVQAFERRNYRQSAGQRAARPSQDSPPKSK